MTDLSRGLTSAQAEKKKAAGESNGSFEIKTKSVGRIFRDNILTLFNLINVILAVLIISVGSWRNLLFMGVVISNTAIGIIQEIRSKRVIDKLSLISAPKARLLRDGKEQSFPVSEIVKGDIMLLGAGNQVCADGLIAEGCCEADESLITGESEPVSKSVGDELLSGSFVVSGSVKAQAVRVGAESFSNRITSGAKTLRKNSSEMMRAINRIITVISCCIFPFGAVLFYKAVMVTQQTFERGIVSTSAALIGMIPEGLVLLTSIALAVSTVRLAKHQTLCQDLYCAEALARVDVLCLDKTGTITEGKMEAGDLIILEDSFDAEGALCALCSAFSDANPTLAALKERFGGECSASAVNSVPFSSARKWSGASFADRGTLLLGAPEFLLGDDYSEALRNKVAEQTSRGMRVLVLAHSDNGLLGGTLPAGISPKALVVLSDKIRESAPRTLEFFRQQGVQLKVISGDDPLTVSKTAARAGLVGAENYIDASTLNDSTIEAAAEQYTVFGRVTPQQKKQLVEALKKNGHKVAMTGDGVNDVLALRAADCSIAMQSGSDAARSVSQLVLLNSDFASLPLAVNEGRRTINNIQRSGALFLTKTIFSFLLAVVFLIVPLPYPFQPIQMTLISALTIGLPSFIMALEPDKNMVQSGFITNILRRAAPGGISAAAAIGLLLWAQHFLSLSQETVSTMAVYITSAVFFGGLFTICLPFNSRRSVMFVLLAAAFAGAAVFFGELFFLVPMGVIEWTALAAIVGIAWILLLILNDAANKLTAKKPNKGNTA